MGRGHRSRLPRPSQGPSLMYTAFGERESTRASKCHGLEPRGTSQWTVPAPRGQSPRHHAAGRRGPALAEGPNGPAPLPPPNGSGGVLGHWQRCDEGRFTLEARPAVTTPSGGPPGPGIVPFGPRPSGHLFPNDVGTPRRRGLCSDCGSRRGIRCHDFVDELWSDAPPPPGPLPRPVPPPPPPPLRK